MQKSIMWEYIREQKEILKKIVCSAEIDNKVAQLSSEIDAVYFVCHGSSYNAAISVASFFSKNTKYRVYCYTPSNFMNNCNSYCYEDKSKILTIGISQTGTSRGTLAALQHANSLGIKTMGITEKADSPITRITDITVNLMCGGENSNAKTKGYSSTLIVLMMLAIKIGVKLGRISLKKAQRIIGEINQSIDEFNDIIEEVIEWCKDNNLGKNIENLYFLGNGMNFGTAMEGQLKLMETMCMPTMFNDIGEFPHGMHRAIKMNSTVILLGTNSEHNETVKTTYRYLRENSKFIYLITTEIDGFNDKEIFRLKAYSEIQSIITMTLVIQIIAVFIPENNGLDPNVESNDDYTLAVNTRN